MYSFAPICSCILPINLYIPIGIYTTGARGSTLGITPNTCLRIAAKSSLLGNQDRCSMRDASWIVPQYPQSLRVLRKGPRGTKPPMSSFF